MPSAWPGLAFSSKTDVFGWALETFFKKSSQRVHTFFSFLFLSCISVCATLPGAIVTPRRVWTCQPLDATRQRCTTKRGTCGYTLSRAHRRNLFGHTGIWVYFSVKSIPASLPPWWPRQMHTNAFLLSHYLASPLRIRPRLSERYSCPPLLFAEAAPQKTQPQPGN